MERNDQTIMPCFQNESIYTQKTHFVCDACIVYIEKGKLQMRFLHYAFLAKTHVSVPFSWPFLAELNEICCGSLLNSRPILKTYRIFLFNKI